MDPTVIHVQSFGRRLFVVIDLGLSIFYRKSRDVHVVIGILISLAISLVGR